MPNHFERILRILHPDNDQQALTFGYGTSGRCDAVQGTRDDQDVPVSFIIVRHHLAPGVRVIVGQFGKDAAEARDLRS